MQKLFVTGYLTNKITEIESLATHDQTEIILVSFLPRGFHSSSLRETNLTWHSSRVSSSTQQVGMQWPNLSGNHRPERIETYLGNFWPIFTANSARNLVYWHLRMNGRWGWLVCRLRTALLAILLNVLLWRRNLIDRDETYPQRLHRSVTKKVF